MKRERRRSFAISSPHDRVDPPYENAFQPSLVGGTELDDLAAPSVRQSAKDVAYPLRLK
jgi:hypothetical protein